MLGSRVQGDIGGLLRSLNSKVGKVERERACRMTPTKPRKTYPQKCKRCNYSWDAIKPHPKACPSCKHYNWDTDLTPKAQPTGA